MTIFEMLLRVGTGVGLGAVIGIERQFRARMAGLRTNALVAVGATLFVLLSAHGFGGLSTSGDADPTRVAAQIVSGIGFLGAGVILRDGLNVRGLNTAATLWATAAVGALCGVWMWREAIVLTVFVLAGNTLLRPLVNAIDRIPLNEKSSEASYEIVVTTDALRAAEIREALDERLEVAKYPVRETEVAYRSEDNVEIVATLVPLAVEAAELDRVTAELARMPGVRHATWNVSALE